MSSWPMKYYYYLHKQPLSGDCISTAINDQLRLQFTDISCIRTHWSWLTPTISHWSWFILSINISYKLCSELNDVVAHHTLNLAWSRHSYSGDRQDVRSWDRAECHLLNTVLHRFHSLLSFSDTASLQAPPPWCNTFSFVFNCFLEVTLNDYFPLFCVCVLSNW